MIKSTANISGNEVGLEGEGHPLFFKMCLVNLSGLLINQKMGGGRESCAAIARPGSGSDPGETCALWVRSDFCAMGTTIQGS